MVPVYLLAGGQSRRFGGRDKARAVVDGKPLLLHAAAALQPLASRVVVVAERPAKYDDLGLQTIADSGAGTGPLDGLRAALDDLRNDESWLLLSGCDLLGLQPEWISRLTNAARDASTAVAFRDHRRWQPLPALAHRSLTPLVAAQLDSCSHALWRLLDQAEACAIPLPVGWHQSIVDINTAADLAAAADRRGPS